MEKNNNKLDLLKQQSIDVSVNFLHNLSKTENFNEMSREQIRSACNSAVKTQIGRTNEVELCSFIEEALDAIIIIVKDLNKDCILTNRLSNGKTIVEMTEKEYLETDEGSIDIFATEWENANIKKETFKEVKFNSMLEEEIKEKSIAIRKEKQLNSKTDRFGFKCLGYKDDKNYVWSNFKQALFVVTQKDLAKNNYINMFGLNFLEATYSKYNHKGEYVGIDTTKLSGDIIDGCVNAGVFNLRNMYGFGIFVDPQNKDHLIINGEEIWGTNPEFKGDRVFGKNVFANIKDLDFPSNIEVATKEETKEWYDLIGTWNYKRGLQDQLLVFGWSIVAPFSGVLNWRTHFSLTGEQGTGKSTLQTGMGNFMGEFALVFDGQSSEAGIRQKVGSSSCAVLIDEAEANSTKIAQTLTFFRTASSSGIVAKGTSDQTGMDFILKLTGMIGGIVAPALNPADLSRFLRIELLPKGEKVHPLLFDIERQNEIGKKTIMFIIKNYKMFKSVCKKVRKNLLADYDNSRYADSFTTLISGAYIGLNQNDNDSDIAEFMKHFNFEKEKIQMSNKDHNNLLNKILKTSFRSEVGMYSVIEMINGLFNKDNDIEMKKDLKRTLGRNGMKVEEKEGSFKLFMSTKDDNFIKIFRGSKFDAGDITSVITRVDGSELLKDSIMIGGTRSQRSTVVVIDLPKKDYSFREEDTKVITVIEDDEIPFN